tara:strand:+ start:81 stop:290 length:210 start_codon:yes stop_codon:yes gene_type:complete
MGATMLQREQNKQFSGPWVVVSTSDQKNIESYHLKENARRAAQSLTQHEKNNGRKNSYSVVHFSDWEKL